MSAVLQLREQLDKLKRKKIELSLSADASISAAKSLLATSSISPLHEIDLKTAHSHLEHAIKDQDELTRVLSDIRKVERELGV